MLEAHLGEDLVNLSSSTNLPLLGVELGKLWEPLNHQEALVPNVLSQVSELGVGGSVGFECLAQTSMVLFKNREAIYNQAMVLGDTRESVVALQVGTPNQLLWHLKQVQNVLGTRQRIKMDSVGLKTLLREAGHHPEVGRTLLVLEPHDRRKLGKDLGQSVAVPQGLSPVHWWADEKIERRPLATSCNDLGHETGENLFNALRH